MNSLTPFIRREMEQMPGPAGAPQATGSRLSPPLGKTPGPDRTDLPPSQPDNPGVQLPPPAVSPGQTPHPGRDSVPQAPIPYTDGTPAGVFQRNAASFLAGDTPGVMASYMPENNRSKNGPDDPRRARPAQESEETVLDLVEWREEAPYG